MYRPVKGTNFYLLKQVYKQSKAILILTYLYCVGLVIKKKKKLYYIRVRIIVLATVL